MITKSSTEMAKASSPPARIAGQSSGSVTSLKVSNPVAPRSAAMFAGSLKMPPPIVTLTMLAARATEPMERTREDSAGAACDTARH